MRNERSCRARLPPSCVWLTNCVALLSCSVLATGQTSSQQHVGNGSEASMARGGYRHRPGSCL